MVICKDTYEVQDISLPLLYYANKLEKMKTVTCEVSQIFGSQEGNTLFNKIKTEIMKCFQRHLSGI
jgi:hypothetical protein